MKVSVFIATSGRSRMFRDMLISLKETVGLMQDLETVIVIDDDPLAFEYAADFPTYSGQVIDYSPKRRGALWAWNRGLQLSSGDILVAAGDDQLFHEGWLEHALVAHRTHCKGFGVVGMNDLAYDGNKQLSTMFIFDRAYCKEHMGGIFAPPMLHYYCVDSWWNDKAKMLGKFFWESKSIVEHLHAAHGKRPIDATDALKDEGWMEEDNRVYAEQKAMGLPVTWESII